MPTQIQYNQYIGYEYAILNIIDRNYATRKGGLISNKKEIFFHSLTGEGPNPKVSPFFNAAFSFRNFTISNLAFLSSFNSS